MEFSIRIRNRDLSAFSKIWGWLVGWGVALFLLGVFALIATTFTTFLSIILIGIMLAIGGTLVIINSFTAWWGTWGGFFSHLLIGVLYLAAGFIFIKNPLFASLSLTFMLGIIFVVLGIFRIAFSHSFKYLNWGWGFFNGVVTLLLGLMILFNWPASSLFVLGIFIGVDLLFCGWSYIMAGLVARHFALNNK